MWFTEDAWSPIILCVVAGVIFFVAWSTTRKSAFLLALPLLLLIAITLFFLERAIVTDGEQVEQNLFSLIDTFVEESQQLVMGSQEIPEEVRCHHYFSVSNTTDRTRVVAALMVVRIDDGISVKDVEVRLTNENTRAVTHFRANATLSAGSFTGHHPSRWELTWQKEAGEWKITRTRMLNVMTGEEQTIPRVD